MMRGDIHVYPENDLIVHAFTRTCWCQPRVTLFPDRALVVHHAADEREQYEEGSVGAHVVPKGEA